MKLALISIAKDDNDSGGPIGLMPLFDSFILEHQVRAAQQIGADRIIFLCPTMPGAILQYVDRLKASDIEAEIVRSARDLTQYASPSDEVFFLGDGILPSIETAQKLNVQKGDAIYVVSNASEFEDFERIDLNQRWLGIAVLNASRLSELSDIPDDWDVGSALLRTAVQADCKRIIISDSEIASRAVTLLNRQQAIDEYTKFRLDAPELSSGNMLEQYVVWPLTRKIIKPLWRTTGSGLYLASGASFFGLVAIILAYLQWPLSALFMLFVCSITLKLSHAITIFSQTKRKFAIWQAATIGLIWIAYVVMVTRHSENDAILPNLIILTVLIGHWFLVRGGNESVRLRRFRPDAPAILIILIVAAILGQFLIGIYLVTIWTTIFLILSALPPRKHSRKA